MADLHFSHLIATFYEFIIYSLWHKYISILVKVLSYFFCFFIPSFKLRCAGGFSQFPVLILELCQPSRQDRFPPTPPLLITNDASILCFL